MTTHPRRIHARRPRVNPWLVVAVLATALVGLASWVIIDETRGKTSSPPQAAFGLASARVAALLEARLAALGSAGELPMARFYSRDAVQEELDVVPPTVAKGREQIAARNEGFSRLWALSGLRVSLASPIIQVGDYAAHGVRIGDTGEVLVFWLDRNGTIAHQWVVGTPIGP
jgi:hypothetical protein